MAGIRDDSAGPYGQWLNPQDQSWADYLGMKAADIGEGAYNALANITGSLSPIGTSEQGNMALQVPPMVSGLVDSAKRIGQRGGFTRVPELDEQLKQDLSNVVLSLYGGNALSGLAKRPPGSVGMFAGVKAKTADHAALARAEEMAGQGIPREQVWNDTGWFQGPDKQWRFEIDDSKATFPGKDYLRHPALYDAYENLSDAKIMRTGRKDEGAYMPGFGPMPDRVLIGPDSGNPRSIALHEFQHGIQNREGFAKGGTPERAPRQLVEQEASRLYEAAKGRQASGVKSEADSLYEDLFGPEQTYTKSWDELPLREQLEWYDPARGNIYNRLAGEVEARTTEKRMDLNADERRARPPWLDFDVPENQQIVRFGETGPQMSVGAKPKGALATAGEQPRGALGAGAMRETEQLGFDFPASKPDPVRAYRGSPSPNDLEYAKQAGKFWASSDPEVAAIYTQITPFNEHHFMQPGVPYQPTLRTVDMEFSNPMTLDAGGDSFHKIPFEGSRYGADALAEIAQKRGHDGLVINNVHDGVRPATTYAALQPNTVRSVKTGETLFSRGAPLPPQQDDNLPPWLKF